MPDQLLYFSAEDIDRLGNIAETARSFLHKRPCTRGDFDYWQSVIKALHPTFDKEGNLPIELPVE